MRSRPFPAPPPRDEFPLFAGITPRRLAVAMPAFPGRACRRVIRVAARVRRTSRPAAWGDPDSRLLLRGLLP